VSSTYGTDSTDLDRLTRKLDEVDHDLDSVRDDLESLTRQYRETVDELRRDVTVQGRDIKGLESEMSSTQTDVESVTKQVTKLAGSVAWLQRHIRASDTAREADFDNHPTSVHDLIDRARRGHARAARLLSDQARRGLERTLTEAATRREKIEQATATALAANKVLISTAYDTPEHQGAADRFRTAYSAREKLIATHNEQADAVSQARRKLAEANTYRDTHSAEIAAGETAEHSLRTRMRTTVADAIGEGALPPTWFDTAFGLTAPRDNTNSWLDLAADVLTYRALYGITDRVLALGPEPDSTDHSPSATTYRDLNRRLHTL
jgi:chromosome segregation ATPase